MGDPRRFRKQFEGPKRLWDAVRIKEERKLVDEYGLKNMRELWRMKTILRKIRREARRLQSAKGANVEERAQRLLARVASFLLNKPNLTLDDVLALEARDILERRLQTITYRKRIANTYMQSRQLIAHGHIAVDGTRTTAPSYLVKFSEESKVNWFKKPVNLPKPENATTGTTSAATTAPVKTEAASSATTEVSA